MTGIHRAGREGIVALATTAVLACGGDGANGPVGNTGSIQVAVNPTALSVQQGGNNSLTVTLTRAGGFSGVVTLAVSGLPTGITASITPTELSGTLTSATINVTVAAAVAAQTYLATITATAQGVSQATANYQVTVTAAPNYALSVTQAAVTIPAGTSGSVTVTIDRTNFTGEVALALLNPPAGITGAFSPTPSTTNGSSLVVSVPANVTPGNYPLTIQGTATGPGVKTTTLAVTVTAPPTGNTTVEYQYCDEFAAPAFFAYQDGGGAWQRVVGSASGDARKFTFNITQGRGGVLEVFGDDEYETRVVYASATELAEDGIDTCAPSLPTKTVTGTVAGVTQGQYGILSLGGADALFIGGTSSNPVTFNDVPGGPVDFVATRMTSPGTPPDRAFIFRNLNVPDGGSVPPIDFNAAGSIVPATATATITGGGSDRLEIFTVLLTANGQQRFWFDLAPSTNASRPWAGIPSSAMVSGDFHNVVVFATPPGSTSGEFRVSLKYVGPVANQTLALGPTIATPSPSLVAPGAYPRFRFQASLPPEYNKGVSIDVLSTQSTGNIFSITATGAYLTASGSALAYDFTMPDVAGLAGFPVAARLTAGPNDVSVSAFGFTGPGIFDIEPSVGREFKGATKRATLNVP